jgi:hypothetical protein
LTEIRRTQSFPIHLHLRLKIIKRFTVNQGLDLLSALGKSKGNERILEFFNTNGTTLFLIERVKIFSEFDQSIIRKSDKVLFAMIFEPKSFAVATLEELFGAIIEIAKLIFRGLVFL